MNDVRLRRLQSDFEAVRRLIHQHPRIRIEGVAGNPPNIYRLFLSVQSLRQSGEHVMAAGEHRLEIRLPLGYPRDPPVCRMLTPVFHPNIAPHAVCIGDHWAAAESIDRLIMRVCEMLAFQSYNTKSPLNGEAARWVDEHPEQLPTDRSTFFYDFAELSSQEDCISPHSQPPARCSNCSNSEGPMERCAAGHLFCNWCSLDCERCGSAKLCLKCGLTQCAACSTST